MDLPYFIILACVHEIHIGRRFGRSCPRDDVPLHVARAYVRRFAPFNFHRHFLRLDGIPDPKIYHYEKLGTVQNGHRLC